MAGQYREEPDMEWQNGLKELSRNNLYLAVFIISAIIVMIGVFMTLSVSVKSFYLVFEGIGLASLVYYLSDIKIRDRIRLLFISLSCFAAAFWWTGYFYFINSEVNAGLFYLLIGFVLIGIVFWLYQKNIKKSGAQAKISEFDGF
ncbi:hypothetical protein [Methanooceanicella nereidis]|nr:hypothetical protein [Methanocella sp. CWC-04]